MQKLSGDGKAFLHAGGHIVERQLDNQKVLVDTGCVVGYRGDIEMNIEKAGNLKSMLVGGEGLFLASLEGTGTVWIQSLPISRLAANIVYASGMSSSTSGSGGGILDSASDLLND